MVSKIQIYNNPQFGKVRILEFANGLWFVGNDIATALGYEKPRNAIATHVDKDDALKQGVPDNHGFIQDTTIINESGMYSLILGSKLPSAKAFKKWVTNEVLPSIRKTGGYLVAKSDDTPEQIMARALIVAQQTLKRKQEQIELAEQKIEEQAPKVLFADSVSASKTSILIGDLAKILKQNGVDIGAKRLFDWMRRCGYLIKQKGMSFNMPTQKAMEKRLFEIKETVITHSDGHTSISKTIKVTGLGQIHFVNKFLNS